MNRLLLIVSFLLLPAAGALAQTYFVRDYGALSNGKTLTTAAVQQAVDAYNRDGGGTVEVPAGTYLVGSIALKTNVNLHLDSGVVLRGSPNAEDYRAYTLPVYGRNHFGILYTTNAANVSLTTHGTIDGNNGVFYDFDQTKQLDTATTRYMRQRGNFRHVAASISDEPVVPKDRHRQMVIFSQCMNVCVTNVALLNSPFWTLHFADCDAVNGIRP